MYRIILRHHVTGYYHEIRRYHVTGNGYISKTVEAPNVSTTATESCSSSLSFVLTPHTYGRIQNTDRHGQRQEPPLSRSGKKRRQRRPAFLLQHIPETRPHREVPPLKCRRENPLPLPSSRWAKPCLALLGLSCRRASSRILFRLRHHRGHHHR